MRAPVFNGPHSIEIAERPDPTIQSRSCGRAGSVGDEEISYQLRQKGQSFKGHHVSLNRLSNLIVKLALTPGMESRHNLGVSAR